MPGRSVMMDELYGPEVSEKVYDRLQSLDPTLNRAIQDIAYDYFWRLPGLSTKEKSLVTILTLFALKKEEQSRIHLNGFFNSTGTLVEARQYLRSIENLIGTEGSLKADSAISDVATNRRMNNLGKAALTPITPIAQSYAQIIVFAARGDLTPLEKEIINYFSIGGSEETLRHSFIQVIVYAGFPSSMNAFAVLNKVLGPQNE